MLQKLLEARDRLLVNPRFSRFASSVPGLRWIARRRARAVFDLVAGFVYSQVLRSCVELKIFALVSARRLTLAELATAVNLPLDACERLVTAAVALRLLERRAGGIVGLGVLGAPLLANEAIQSMVLHHAALYSDLENPVALLRGELADTKMRHYWPYASVDHPDQLRGDQSSAYSTLMSSTQSLIVDEVLAAYSFRGHACLMDVGGGEGVFLRGVGTRWPELQLRLFDLPSVVARAHDPFAASGFADRIRTTGGDFFNDPLPQHAESGADIVSLVRVLHDHDDARVAHLLRAVAAALPVGGTLLVAEPLAEIPGAETVGGAYFGFYFLAMGRGEARSFARLSELMSDAGFRKIRLLPTRIPLQTSVIVAKKS